MSNRRKIAYIILILLPFCILTPILKSIDNTLSYTAIFLIISLSIGVSIIIAWAIDTLIGH